jgi:hypothetical protein
MYSRLKVARDSPIESWNVISAEEADIDLRKSAAAAVVKERVPGTPDFGQVPFIAGLPSGRRAVQSRP